jgi:hypothetical protein
MAIAGSLVLKVGQIKGNQYRMFSEDLCLGYHLGSVG